jgi:hypothetical protein
MLHMFAIVFKVFLGIFAGISDACFKCFICLLLYVATAALDQVLHMECAWETAGGVATSTTVWTTSKVARARC